MDPMCKKKLINLRPNLVKQINTDAKFYRTLREMEIITARQEARIRNSGDSQTETLLDLLVRLDNTAFTKFHQALEKTGQKEAAQTLHAVPAQEAVFPTPPPGQKPAAKKSQPPGPAVQTEQRSFFEHASESTLSEKEQEASRLLPKIIVVTEAG